MAGMEKYRIAPFVRLGELLHAELETEALEPLIAEAVAVNPWFTRENIYTSLRAIIAEMLDGKRLNGWLERYAGLPAPEPKTVGIVMAGNIPLVGFFDLLCVCICGHRCLAKPSSKDRLLMEYVIARLREADPGIRIEPLGQDDVPDAVIATGSDNTNRYFRSRYGSIPALLRSSRTSVAVLDGSESDKELEGLAEDIFLYGGLGCRNVGKLLLPEGYDLQRLVRILSRHPVPVEGFRNSCRQARALAALNGEDYIDGNFFILKENTAPGAPIGVIGYERYRTLPEAGGWLERHDREIQCVVTRAIAHPRSVPFGEAQHPSLHDYPDGVDTIRFLHAI